MITTYLSYDIFAPDVGVEQRANVMNPFTTLGDIHNARQVYVTKETTSSFSVVVFQDTQADRVTLRNFFETKKGKLSPFWYFNPIPVGRVLQTETGGFAIRLTDSSKVYLSSTQLIYLYFEGNDTVSKVVDVATKYSDVLGNHEEITINDIILTDIPVGSLVYVLFFVRFDQDTLSIDFQDYSRSSSKLVLKELQADLKALNL